MQEMSQADGTPRDGEPQNAKGRGPLMSRYPGELALRDAAGATALEAQLCAARFAVLQLAERYAGFGIDAIMLATEIEAAEAYVTPVNERGPADALRLRRVLDSMRAGNVRAVVAGLLATGDTARAGGQIFASAGFHGAAFDLAMRIGWNAGALSAASRMADLALSLQRPKSAHRWQRLCAERVAACH
jgi:hypothetical protein